MAIVPKEEKENSLFKGKYTYRAFDSKFDIRTSINSNNLPLVSFKVSNDLPCIDDMSPSSLKPKVSDAHENGKEQFQ